MSITSYQRENQQLYEQQQKLYRKQMARLKEIYPKLDDAAILGALKKRQGSIQEAAEYISSRLFFYNIFQNFIIIVLSIYCIESDRDELRFTTHAEQRVCIYFLIHFIPLVCVL